jgi:hypothetical protein
MNFQIYTMFVNREEVLRRAIRSLGRYEAQLVVLDNSPDQTLLLKDFSGEIFKPHVPLYCNQSYNLILSTAEQRDQEVFFIMHSDAEASESVVEALLARAEELNQEQRNWGVLFTNYDVLCLMNTRLLQRYRWDPHLPLYYTDVDFYYRLGLAGIEVIETYLPVVHQEGGSTTHSDPDLKAFIESNYPAWRHYYMLKWGGDRGQERFTQPFNRSEAEPPRISVTIYPRQNG